MREWEEKQAELQKEGLDAKTMVNLSSDRQRNNNLTILKEQGVPFTTSACVDSYLN